MSGVLGDFWRRSAEIADRVVLGRLFLGALAVYRVLFSWLFRGACRFVPSCSSYAREAIVRYGGIRGAAMTAARILRCHPFHPGGYDPVP